MVLKWAQCEWEGRERVGRHIAIPEDSCIRGSKGDEDVARKRSATEVWGKPGVWRVRGGKRKKYFKELKAAEALSKMRRGVDCSTWVGVWLSQEQFQWSSGEGSQFKLSWTYYRKHHHGRGAEKASHVFICVMRTASCVLLWGRSMDSMDSGGRSEYSKSNSSFVILNLLHNLSAPLCLSETFASCSSWKKLCYSPLCFFKSESTLPEILSKSPPAPSTLINNGLCPLC